MRLPSVEDLSVLYSRMSPTITSVMNERITTHLNTLWERLDEAYRVVIANNQTARVK
jgi:hypothetical protein